MLIELDPVDRITTGAVGPPGERVFYLQGRKGDQLITVLVEKQQVELLAASVMELLSRLGREPPEADEEADVLELEEPVVPEWRAGRLALGFDEGREAFLLEAEELVPDDEDADEEVDDDPEDDRGRVRFWATGEQLVVLAKTGMTVAAAGRPRCELCGNPMDPDGHVCPALNGHRGDA